MISLVGDNNSNNHNDDEEDDGDDDKTDVAYQEDIFHTELMRQKLVHPVHRNDMQHNAQHCNTDNSQTAGHQLLLLILLLTRSLTSQAKDQRRMIWLSLPAMGHWDTCPPRLPSV